MPSHVHNPGLAAGSQERAATDTWAVGEDTGWLRALIKLLQTTAYRAPTDGHSFTENGTERRNKVLTNSSYSNHVHGAPVPALAP